MTTTELKGLEFDPGFGPYILAFRGTLEYLYADMNRYKNFSQKKLKFMQYHKKIIEMFENNVGFYVGCLMWAAYIKTQSKQKILSNHCLGQEYNEEANVSDTQFMIQFTSLFPKDMKYFLGQNYSFDEKIVEILKVYEEFLVLNKGFVSSEFNTGIELPKSVKVAGAQSYKLKIEEVLKTEDLSKLLEYLPEIL